MPASPSSPPKPRLAPRRRRTALIAAFSGCVLLLGGGSAQAVTSCVPSPLPILGCAPPSPAPAPPPPSGGGGGGTPAPPPATQPPPKPPPTPRTHPNRFAGLVSEDVFYGSPAYRKGMLAAQARIGVGTLRQVFDWASIERTPNRFDFSVTDGFVEAAARDHIAVLPILFNAPVFRDSGPAAGRKRGFYPPRKPADMGRFAAAAARRYGPHGSFWSSHRGVPRVAIRSWQIWNEPNLPVYWQPRPNARNYVRLLAAARRSLKHVDRHAEIVTAGLPDSHLGQPVFSYIAAMYHAGGRAAFDTLAVHPYAHTVGSVKAKLLKARRLMNHFHDKSGRMWVTEFGWADKSPANNRGFTSGPKGQGRDISNAIKMFAHERRRLRLRGFVYYNWHDQPPYAGGPDFWGFHTGLLFQDGTPKPARNAFAAAVRRLR